MQNDNKQYWFKPKRFGYGLEPCSWQGWLATLIFTGCILLNAYLNNFFTENISDKNIIKFIIILILLIILFIKFSAGKTKGKIKWNWGK